mgnify:CR=1 FL=1
MNLKKIIIATMFFCGVCSMHAQIRKTVTVTQENGVEEEIDLPESMTQELDSLMGLYNSKMYLKELTV